MPRTAKNPNAKTHACPYCDKVFQSINSVYAHVRAKHPGKTYSTKTCIVPQNTTQPADTTRIKQLLVDLRLKFVEGEIDVTDYMTQKNLLETSLDKVQKDWEEENTCDISPTLDFKIFDNVREGDEPYIEVRKYIIEHGLFDKLKHMIDANEYGKAFLLLFTDNLKVSDDNKYDLLGNLLYTVSYLHNGVEKTVGDITTQNMWKWFYHLATGMCYMVMNKLIPPEVFGKSSDTLTLHDEEAKEVGLSKFDDINVWWTTTLEKISESSNDPIKKSIEQVLNGFSKKLRI